jgi:rRNA maturation endonuclease Nob1
MTPVQVGDVFRTRERKLFSTTLFATRCGVCRRFMSSGPEPVCKRCGTSYREWSDGFHQVVACGRD